MVAEAHGLPVWTFDPAHTIIEFSVLHMLIFTVKGRFTRISGRIEGDIERDPEHASIYTSIAANSLDARDDERNAYLQAEIFDVARYPHIEFVSKRIEPQGDRRYRIAGDLTLRGITRPIALDAVFHGHTTGYNGRHFAGFTATTELNRHDWYIVWNAAIEASGTVGERVTIEIQVAART